MKYQVIGLNEDGSYVGYKQDVFDTQLEADTFIGIEMTQIQEENVELIIVKLIEEER